MERNQPYVLNPPAGRPTNSTQAVDFLIACALQMQASDIHLGLNNDGTGVDPILLRLRTHGKLQHVKSAFLTPIYDEVIARFKILAGINTTEIGIPQDGQINMSTTAGPVVLRLNIIPGPDGDEMVIRVQLRTTPDQSISKLGMVPAMETQFNRLTRQMSGLIVLNGPAGAGKTSSIYSILKSLASPERKILTAEDPIETRLPFVSHTQITAKTSFAALSRAFMRQDSDIIFIGEVRDAESAGAAIRLAQTGHLVLTTMHTRDALGVIPRLEAFEVHTNFIASALIGSLAQRLVPLLCPHCNMPANPSRASLDQWSQILPPSPDARILKAGPGCENCIGGYIGRRAIFELLVVDPEISDLINRGGKRHEILAMARKKGMRTLAEDVMAHVYAGTIDINSVKAYLIGPADERTAA